MAESPIKTFQELADEYIINDSIKFGTNNEISQVTIMKKSEKSEKEVVVRNFHHNELTKNFDELSLLLRRINVYNMYIKSFNKCQNIEENAFISCMLINKKYEEETGQSSRNEHGSSCSHIFQFFESIDSLDKNLINKQKIYALIGEVHEYVTKIKLNKKGGKFKSNKKRKTNKRKKTNKRRKTKTNKRKKRTRRRR